MTIENTRLENARALAREAGTSSKTSFGGSVARFAARVGMTTQLASNYIGERPVKIIGSDMARRFERAFERPVGWLDSEHSAPSTKVSDSAITIQGLDVGGILGPGRLPMLLDSTVQQMQVSKDWLRKNLGARPADYLALATVTGDSMGEALPNGSMVVVDRGASEVHEDGIYMLGRKDPEQPGVWFRHVKRQLDGTYRISTQHRADKSVVPDLAKAGIIVLGRVVARLELKPL